MTLSPQNPLMFQEARQIPSVLRRQLVDNAAQVADLSRLLARRTPSFAVTIARGSSDHACTYLKYALETQLGLPVASLGPSVHTLYGARLRLKDALVLAVSQSGSSPDVVETLRMARQAGAITVTLVNVEDSDLAREAEIVLPLRCGEERAVAATKSFAASLTAFLPVIAALGPDPALTQGLNRLPDVLDAALGLEQDAQDLAQRYRTVSSLLILARGLNFGIAQEAALKLKETCGVHAEASSAAEFSHGPKRLMAEHIPLLGLSSVDAAESAAQAMYTELLESGADLQTIGPAANSRLRTPTSGHPLTDPVITALVFYLFAGHLALARGLNPDAPPFLSKVTRTR